LKPIFETDIFFDKSLMSKIMFWNNFDTMNYIWLYNLQWQKCLFETAYIIIIFQRLDYFVVIYVEAIDLIFYSTTSSIRLYKTEQ